MSEHYYDKDGNPHHFVEKKDGSGNRPTTLADARKNGWYPSVTTILKAAARPNLERWKVIQAATAVLTSPRKEGEDLDAFMDRVLFKDKEAEEEAKRAADLGSAIHDAIEKALSLGQYDRAYEDYVEPALEWIKSTGTVIWSEKVLVGDGYAGRSDCLLESPDAMILTDFKTTSKLPEKDSWPEHKLQTAAYAAVQGHGKKVLTCNVYISTKEPGKIAVFTQDDWWMTFHDGFTPLFQYWTWANKYVPPGVVLP